LGGCEVNREEVKERIIKARVIAVVRASDVEAARELVEAYIAAGVKTVELTTSIRGWETLLEIVCGECEVDTVVGVGTVTAAEEVDRAVDLGAGFIVSPFVSETVMESANINNVSIIPGALTPSEIARAYDLGADMVKVFPVSSVGGPAYIEALLAPMPGWELVPTGGVTTDNAVEYFRAGAVAVGLGGNLAPRDKVRERDWDGVISHVNSFLAELDRRLKESDS
jgi:2-dehydro-3-deoxyphosphogluconate aldolase/(4S)-4-hydroxy-2-oxoglutarate aldolase